MTGGQSRRRLRPGRWSIDGPLSCLQPRPPLQNASPPPGASGRQVVAVSGIVGAGLLGLSFSRRPGSKEFYLLTVGVAGTLTAGTVLSGSGPPLGVRGPEARWARPLVTSVVAGVGAFGLFYGAAHLARRAPLLERAVSRALAYERESSTPLVLLTTGLNGIAEEMFYRGALWSIVADSNPIAKTTLAYTAATAATRNLALVFAGTATSLLFGYQRRAMGGVLGPTITHLTWSMLMLRYLPPLFGASGGRPDAATART
jgi:membrane protease YdiL (CAAX protease family)